MYQKIMIPLDGSELAECVLPEVEAFLRGSLVKTAVFIMVVEPVPIILYNASVTFDMVKYPETLERDIFPPNMEYWETKRAERKISGTVYLDHIANRFHQYGVKIECEVLDVAGRVAKTLADYAEDNHVDMILMATHGRSGVGRWLMGSVAEGVLLSSRAPVLMVKAAGSAIAKAA